MAQEIESAEYSQVIQELCVALPKNYELTDESLDAKCDGLADALLEKYPSDIAEIKLRGIEAQLSEDIEKAEQYPIGVHLPVKMAISKLYAKKIDKKVKLSVVVPMYKENRRIRRKSEDEHGENFLRRKARQLAWLFDGTSVTWELIFVDDGCPKDSGKLAQDIVSQEGIKNVKVLLLQDGIDQGKELLKQLHISSTKDCVKAGSVLYGFSEAIEDAKGEQFDQHILCFTDADMSTPLGQSGLLLEEVVNQKHASAIGTRYGPGGLKSGISGYPHTLHGIRTVHLIPLIVRSAAIQKLLPPLNKNCDTQCGFKAFDSNAVKDVLPKMEDVQATFDIELLMRVSTQTSEEMKESGSGTIGTAPTFWIDSPDESNFWSGDDDGIGGYLSFFHRIVKLREKFKEKFQPDSDADQLAGFYEAMDVPEFLVMMGEITKKYEAEKFDFGVQFDVDELKKFSSP